MNVENVEFSSLTEDDCWQAALTRDTGFDGVFVTAVLTTGIYCRPSCPARMPKREHTIFFPDNEAAVAAGFRACKRCRPDEQLSETELVERICRYIEAHLNTPLTLSQLGTYANVSPYHLQRVFKQIMGITPREYTEACRLDKLKDRLKQGATVTDALYDVGYNSSSRLYEQASSRLGMTPSTYRQGGQGMHIRYTIVDSMPGRLLVATTERGICAISLGDSDEFLEDALWKDYPAAEIKRAETGFGEWLAASVKYLNGDRPHLDLPPDIRATAFQRQVWEALQALPSW